MACVGKRRPDQKKTREKKERIQSVAKDEFCFLGYCYGVCQAEKQNDCVQLSRSLWSLVEMPRQTRSHTDVARDVLKPVPSRGA